MGGMKADGVIYLAAEFLDTFNEISKQVNKGVVQVEKNNKIKLSVEERSLAESIEKALGSKRIAKRGLDLSDMVVPALQKASDLKLSQEDRTRALKDLEENLFTLQRAPMKVLDNIKGANSKDITAAVQKINQDMLDNPIKWSKVVPSKEIGRMLTEMLSTAVIDIQKQLTEEFGADTAKYGVDAKTAKTKMETIYKKAFNEEGELDPYELYDDEFSDTSQAIKDFRAYYQRLGKLGEKIPEKFEELFEVISDHLDMLDGDEGTEKAVKDWIESIFTLEDRVIDYANKEASLNKQAADKLETQKKQAGQDKSSGRNKINPTFDTKIEEPKETAPSSSSTTLTTSTQKQDKIQRNKNQQQEIQEIASTAQTATESNKQLAKSVQEVTQAVQQEGQAMSNSSIDDYLVKWIEMVKGTKAYSGLEERAVYLKGGVPTSDIGQGKLSYKNGFVQGQTSIRQYKDGGADTLLHSHQYSKDVDNLRFSFADIKQGMSDLAEGVQDGIRKLILSCGDEILSLDFGNVSKETASEVQENIRQIYTAAWTIFGGQVFSDGTASERGMTDELRNKASAFINTMLRKMLEEMGGSLTSGKLIDGKIIDTTSSRLSQAITPQQQSLYEQIKKIYGLSENEYEGYRGDILKKLQKDNGIETNLTGLVGLSPEQLKEVDNLLSQIFYHKQQLENAKAGSRMAASIQEKIDEAEKRITELTKVPNKDVQQQKDIKTNEAISQEDIDTSQKKLEIVEKIEEVENNITDNIKEQTDLSSQEQVQQQTQQEIQKEASTVQFATEANKQLAESTQEVTQAIQQEEQVMSSSSINDFLVKWIELIGKTEAYSGLEERVIGLKNGKPTTQMYSEPIGFKGGVIQGSSQIDKFAQKNIDTLLQSRPRSYDVDNLHFDWADLETEFSNIEKGVQGAIERMILSCGHELLTLDFSNISKEGISNLKEKLKQLYNATWVLFGGEIDKSGNISEKGMTDTTRSKASVFINTMMKEIVEEAGGKVFTQAVHEDGKIVDTSWSRLDSGNISQNLRDLLQEIFAIYNQTGNDNKNIGEQLKTFQQKHNIKTNESGIVGLSEEELKELDDLLLERFQYVQEWEKELQKRNFNAPKPVKMKELEDNINEVEEEIDRVTGKRLNPSIPTKRESKKDLQEVLKQIEKEKEETQSDINIDDSQKELESAKQIEETENNIVDNKKKQTEEIQKQNDALQQQKENESNIKNQNEDVVDEKEEVIEKAKEGLQVEQQLTNELKEQKNIEQASGGISQEDKKQSELQTIKEIKEETQQIAEEQQKITEAKEGTLQATQEELKAEQQLSTETQNQEKAEEKKPKIMLVHKGKKLADVQRHGKTQAEIDNQIKTNEEKKKKKSSFSQADSDERKKAYTAAAADAEAEKEKQRQQEINDKNFLAALTAKLAEAEAQQAEKEAQKIQLTSEQMQKLKQGIQEATEALKEYKEIDEQIVKAQSDKDSLKISKITQDEMLDAGAFSSFSEAGRFIQSAYRTYKKTGNKQDETILKEALKYYMSPVKRDKEGNFEHRPNDWLFGKKDKAGNYKEIKAYKNDKKYNEYIENAQKENAAYEYAVKNLPLLEEQKQAGQHSYAEASAKIQQLLQETGLDAEKVNEILAAINGNLTNEEAIWKVINSYIKEASEELDKQKELTKETEDSISEKPNENVASKVIPENKIEQTDITEQEEKNQQAIEKTIELTEELQEQTQELTTPKTVESSVISQIGEEAKETKQKVDEVTNSVKKAKGETKKTPTSKKKTITDSEFSYKEYARGHIRQDSDYPYFNKAKEWTQSGINSSNIEKLKTYYQQYKDIVNKIKSTKDKPENKSTFESLVKEYDNIKKAIESVISVIEKANSEENKMLANQKAQADIIKGTINNRATLARNAQKNLDSNYYDKQIARADTILSQYTPTESPEAARAIEQANDALDKYKSKVDELKRFSTGDLELDRPFEELIKEVNKAGDEVKELTKNIQDNFSKIANSNSITDFQSQIKSILSTYNRITPESKQRLEGIFGSLKAGETTTKQLADAKTQLKAILADERELGNLSANIFDRMTGKIQEGIAYLATKFSFYQIFNQFKKGFEIIHQFDDALTEMMKVSDETRTSLERYQKTTFETADAIGTNALQIQNSTADFMRLGETLNQAAESAKSANVLMNVSEFQSIDEATKSLIAMGAAYDDLSKMNIIDKLNEVGNNYAISTSEAATALQSSASALKTAGNDMDEALALITAGNAVVQDATKVGTGMRTIALRLTGKAMCPNIE